MVYIYRIFILSCLFFLIFVRRKWNIFYFSAICGMIYFFPAVFGYVLDPRSYLKIKINMEWKTYCVYMLFVFSVLCAGYFVELKKSNVFCVEQKSIPSTTIKVLNLIMKLLFVIYVVLFYHVMFENKVLIWEVTSKYDMRVYTFLMYYALFLLLLCYLLKLKNKYAILPALSIFLTFINGFRTMVIIVFLGVFLFKLYTNENIFNFKNIAFLCCVFVVGFYGKIIALYIFGDSQLEFKYIDFFNSLLKSEPMITQYILNMTIKYDFTLHISHILNWVLKLFFVNNELFNEIFNFKFSQEGIGSNIFAEIYAIGKIGGIMIFITIYILLLFFLDKCIRSKNHFIKAYGLLLGCIFSFFIHRLQMVGIIFNVQICTFILFLVYVVDNCCKKYKIVWRKHHVGRFFNNI